MSVEFSNAYQEILLDNVVAVIKQNFVFQTQLKLTENIGKEKAELESKYNQLLKSYEELKPLAEEAESYKSKIQQNSSAHEEKTRIQIALNESLKKNVALQQALEKKNDELKELKQQISELKLLIAPSKLKKINSNEKQKTDGSQF